MINDSLAPTAVTDGLPVPPSERQSLRPRVHRTRGDLSFFCLSLLPGIVLSIATIFIPVFYAIRLSFYRAGSFVDIPVFVGFGNYLRIFRDPQYWHAFLNGILYAGVSVVLQVVVGIGSALLLNQAFRGRVILRALALTPYLLPTVVAVFVWKWLLDPNYGMVNAFATSLGLTNIDWLGTPLAAWFSVILVSVWHWTPFVTVTFLAALQSVPHELHEAAQIDGATAWHRLIHITLPVLRPVVLVIILLRTIFMFNKFDIIWLMTAGGPVNATEHLPMLTYSRTFQEFDIGGGTAIATTSFVFLTVGMLIYQKFFPLDARD